MDAQIDKQLDTMADRIEKLDEKIKDFAAKAKEFFTRKK